MQISMYRYIYIIYVCIYMYICIYICIGIYILINYLMVSGFFIQVSHCPTLTGVRMKASSPVWHLGGNTQAGGVQKTYDLFFL